MNDNQALAEQINRCFRANAFKAVFAAGALLLFQVFIMFFMFILLRGTPILALPLLILTGMALLMVQYGFVIILYKLYAGKRAIIGDLFAGFRDLKRIGLGALRFFGINCAVCLACIVVMTAVMTAFPGALTRLSLLITGAMLLYAALVLLVLLPYAFVWLEMYTSPRLGAKEAFKKSARLMKENKLRLAALCLRVGGVFLVIALVLYVLNLALIAPVLPDLAALGLDPAAVGAVPTQAAPSGIPQSALTSGIGSALFDLAYYVSMVITLIKVLLGISALYTEVAHHDGQGAALELPPQSIESPV